MTTTIDITATEAGMTSERAAPAAGGIAQIERRMELRASPERVWRALTEQDEITGWFGDRASFEPIVGAEGWFEFEGYGRSPVRVEHVEPGRAISWRWTRGPAERFEGAESSLVEWWLEPGRNGGTILNLRESGFTDAAWRNDHAEGWLGELADLAAHVAAEPWQAGYRQTYVFTSLPERVWRALTDFDELRAWQGFTQHTPGGVGDEIWLTWPDRGRWAIRFDALEPSNYIAESHTMEPDTSLADAAEVLHTSWFIKGREDGGTDLQLFEIGYLGPDRASQNAAGWDGDLIPVIRTYLGEG